MDDSPLSRLPREIRDLIYHHIGGREVEVVLYLPLKCRKGKHPMSHNAIISSIPHLSVLLVCRELATEYADSVQARRLQFRSPYRGPVAQQWNSPEKSYRAADLKAVLRSVTRVEIDVDKLKQRRNEYEEWPADSEAIFEALKKYTPLLRDVRYDYQPRICQNSIDSIAGKSEMRRAGGILFKKRFYTSQQLFSTTFRTLGLDEGAKAILGCSCFEQRMESDVEQMLDEWASYDPFNYIVYRRRPTQDFKSWHEEPTFEAGYLNLQSIFGDFKVDNCQGTCSLALSSRRVGKVGRRTSRWPAIRMRKTWSHQDFGLRL